MHELLIASAFRRLEQPQYHTLRLLSVFWMRLLTVLV